MRGNDIVLNVDPKGRFLEGIISGTPLPGTWVQIQAGTPFSNGRPTFEAYNPGASGDPRLIAILLADNLQGQLPTAAYVSGTRCFVYCPLPGDELNVLVKNLAGTADSFAIGDRLIGDKGTGKFVIEVTSSVFAPFTVQEAVAALTADTLVWVMAS